MGLSLRIIERRSLLDPIVPLSRVVQETRNCVKVSDGSLAMRHLVDGSPLVDALLQPDLQDGLVVHVLPHLSLELVRHPDPLSPEALGVVHDADALPLVVKEGADKGPAVRVVVSPVAGPEPRVVLPTVLLSRPVVRISSL